MDYYLLSIDKDYTDMPKPTNWFGKIDVESIYRGEYSNLEKAYALEIKENADIYTADIITEPVFAVSKMVKTCIEAYEPNIGFTRIYFVQRKEERVFEYFIPHLTLEDCLVSKKQKVGYGNTAQTPKIDLNRVEEDKFIFRAREGTENHIVVKTEFLESVLRRGARGIHVVSVETES
ncbi:MAG: hypothetical protein IJF37_10460 [Lachnospiraceae bacterium]|nr:hypothetical protein [Lachnospiraceae bacterium]